MRAVVVVAALALAPPAAAAAPVEVHAALGERSVLFGAPTTAVVTVVVDPRAADPDSVRVEADVTPLRRVAPTRTERTDADGLVVITQQTRVACTSDPCRPGAGLRRVALSRVLVRVTGATGARLSARAAWPPLLVASRVPADAATGEPAWRTETTPPTVTYRLTPSVLTAFLWGASALLGVAAVLLVLREVARARGRRRAVRRSDLDAALQDVRAALGAGVAERRRAVGSLARALGRRHNARSADAAALAWAPPEPDPRRLALLADEVEREGRT